MGIIAWKFTHDEDWILLTQGISTVAARFWKVSDITSIQWSIITALYKIIRINMIVWCALCLMKIARDEDRILLTSGIPAITVSYYMVAQDLQQFCFH